MAIVLNPRSGSAPDEAKLGRALRAVDLGADIRHVPTSRVGDWVADIARRYDVLVAAGGDGTVSTVAAAAVQGGRTFGVLPAGTLNHFARDVGIPLDLEEAVDVLAAGHTGLFDVGTVNGLIFINNASVGAYPRLVWERARARRKGLLRKLQEHDRFEMFQASCISMDLARRRIRIALDGEIRVLAPPLRFGVMRHALRVIVPATGHGER